MYGVRMDEATISIRHQDRSLGRTASPRSTSGTSTAGSSTSPRSGLRLPRAPIQPPQRQATLRGPRAHRRRGEEKLLRNSWSPLSLRSPQVRRWSGLSRRRVIRGGFPGHRLAASRLVGLHRRQPDPSRSVRDHPCCFRTLTPKGQGGCGRKSDQREVIGLAALALCGLNFEVTEPCSDWHSHAYSTGSSNAVLTAPTGGRSRPARSYAERPSS
jgi:hypothetical protein